ncbi:MAG TPA: L,D-transpeptidase [Rhodoblastus sp.]|nr:L,D-transpeptidase [Rhodoblastus sp.]
MSNPSYRAAARALPARSRAVLTLGLAAALFGALIATPRRAAAAERVVPFAQAGDLRPGTLVISARQRALYYVLDNARAIRYPIAVPKRGKEWSGVAYVDGKYLKPDWAPPAVVKRDHPELPNLIPGGSPRNPMGVAALTLNRDQIAIHGTTQSMRRSIGSAASYGCIRMYNEDVADLYSRVSVGTQVVMVQ